MQSKLTLVIDLTLRILFCDSKMLFFDLHWMRCGIRYAWSFPHMCIDYMWYLVGCTSSKLVGVSIAFRIWFFFSSGSWSVPDCIDPRPDFVWIKSRLVSENLNFGPASVTISRVPNSGCSRSRAIFGTTFSSTNFMCQFQVLSAHVELVFSTIMVGQGESGTYNTRKSKRVQYARQELELD